MNENIPQTTGVIISTYNNPQWLERTLWGYCRQSHRPDEIVIADDGSTGETRKLILSYCGVLPIKHVWHEDRGFQKSEILNKALMAAAADYLIFTDQDCIPRRDFVATHRANARRGRFISGGYFKLTMEVSMAVTRADIESGAVFSPHWLRGHGQPLSFKMTKLLGRDWFAKMMNALTPTRATWNGCNSSCWRADALAVNGYNEDMHYGGQDCEFGERLVNMGIEPIQMRYSAIVAHLDHKRPYKTLESIETNKAIRRNTRQQHIVRTPNGIEKLGEAAER